MERDGYYSQRSRDVTVTVIPEASVTFILF